MIFGAVAAVVVVAVVAELSFVERTDTKI